MHALKVGSSSYSESVTCEPFDSFIFTPDATHRIAIGTDVEDLSMHLAPTLDVHAVVCIDCTGSLLASPNHHFVPYIEMILKPFFSGGTAL